MAIENKRKKKPAEGRDLPNLLPLRTKKKVTRNPNPSPSLTSCHRCNITSSDLRTLDSQWRISLLCKNCHDLVQSAMVCSYCFVPLSEDEDVFLNCLQCFRRIHYACIPHHRFYVLPSQIDPESFSCVDCCPVPKSPNLTLNPTYRVSPAPPAQVSDSRWIMNGSKRILKSSARNLCKEDSEKEAKGSKSVQSGLVRERDFDPIELRSYSTCKCFSSDPTKFMVTYTEEHNHALDAVQNDSIDLVLDDKGKVKKGMEGCGSDVAKIDPVFVHSSSPHENNTSLPSSSLEPADAEPTGKSHLLAEKVSQSNRSIPADSNESADMWNWKKYGERHIRGSLYPRIYYRCERFSKGCPARKHVEQSQTNLQTFDVRYVGKHNHRGSTSKL